MEGVCNRVLAPAFKLLLDPLVHGLPSWVFCGFAPGHHFLFYGFRDDWQDHRPQRYWVVSEGTTVLGQGFLPIGAVVEQASLVLALAIADEIIEPSALDNVPGTTHVVDVEVAPQLEAVALLIFATAQHVTVIGLGRGQSPQSERTKFARDFPCNLPIE